MSKRKYNDDDDHNTGLVRSDSEGVQSDRHPKVAAVEQPEAQPSEVKWDSGVPHNTEGQVLGTSEGVLRGEDAEKARKADEDRENGTQLSKEDADAARKEHEQKLKAEQEKALSEQNAQSEDAKVSDEDGLPKGK